MTRKIIGRQEVDNGVTFIASTDPGVNNTLFLDTADNVLKLRDNSGTVAPVGSGSGGGAAATIERKIEGAVYTGTLMPFIIPDALDGLDITEVRLAVSGLPTGSALKVDIRKNGTATTDSIFTSDTEIEISTTETATNGLYQSGCDSSSATVGTPGTTIDSTQDTVSADDVLWFVITQVGSSLAGTDLNIEISIS